MSAITLRGLSKRIRATLTDLAEHIFSVVLCSAVRVIRWAGADRIFDVGFIKRCHDAGYTRTGGMADIKSIKVSNNISHETGPPRKKRKKNPSDIAGPKNPVLALNEIKPNLVYNYTERGPAHAKIFEASIIFNGQCYTAEDTTKKKAKARVAQMILHSAVQLKDPTIKPPLAPVGPTAEDFSEDLINSDGDGQDFFSFESTIKEQVTKAAPAPALISPKRAAQSSPSFQLNLLKPGIKIEIVKDEGEPHCKKYTARGNV